MVCLCFLMLFAPLARAGVKPWAETIILMTAIVAFGAGGMHVVRTRHWGRFKTPWTWLVVATLGWSLLSALFSGDRALGFLAWQHLLGYVALFYATLVAVSRPADIRRMVGWILCCASLVAIIGYLKIYQVPLPWWEYGIETPRLAGSFGNPNHFAACPRNRPPNPHDAEPYFEAAITMRPRGVNNYLLPAHYPDSKKNWAGLEEVVQRLVSHYPPIGLQLRRERFFNEGVEAAVIRGLRDATAAHYMLRDAYLVWAELSWQRSDFVTAAVFYVTGLGYDAHLNQPTHQVQLGYLRLRAGEADTANEAFMAALTADPVNLRLMQSVLNHLAQHGTVENLHGLHQALKGRLRLSHAQTYALANTFARLDDYDTAIGLIRQVLSYHDAPEAHYHLALIARMQKNWDQMELAAQKAAMLGRSNSAYHLLFSQALVNRKKYPAAEAAATQAIRYAPKPDAALYRHRANLRTILKQYPDAIADIEQALKLQPGNHGLQQQLDRLRGRP